METKLQPGLQRGAAAGTLPETMHAVQITQAQAVTLVETPIPAPGDGEVLVQVEGCGVCGSSLPLWEGREWFNYPLPPGNPGHEAWGRIAARGAAVPDDLRVGDRVAMLSNNAFAEYDVAQAHAVIKLPE